MELGNSLRVPPFFLNSPLNICCEFAGSWFLSLYRALHRYETRINLFPFPRNVTSRSEFEAKRDINKRGSLGRKKRPFRIAVARYLARVGNSCSVARTEHVVYSRKNDALLRKVVVYGEKWKGEEEKGRSLGPSGDHESGPPRGENLGQNEREEKKCVRSTNVKIFIRNLHGKFKRTKRKKLLTNIINKICNMSKRMINDERRIHHFLTTNHRFKIGKEWFDGARRCVARFDREKACSKSRIFFS